MYHPEHLEPQDSTYSVRENASWNMWISRSIPEETILTWMQPIRAAQDVLRRETYEQYRQIMVQQKSGPFVCFVVVRELLEFDHLFGRRQIRPVAVHLTGENVDIRQIMLALKSPEGDIEVVDPAYYMHGLDNPVIDIGYESIPVVLGKNIGDTTALLAVRYSKSYGQDVSARMSFAKPFDK